MRRLALAAPLAVLLAAAVLLSGDRPPEGRYRKPASPETIRRWQREYRAKQALVPDAPAPKPSTPATGVEDFTGRYRFGRYDYALEIRQEGDRVSFRSGGVDRQDIGGAFETVGTGVVRGDRLFARWWCFDLSRNYANNGGAVFRFVGGDRDRIHVRYYHDADERIEEGYGVRSGTHEGEKLHYRIRVPQPVRKPGRAVALGGTVRGADGELLEDAVVMLRHDERSAVRTDARGRWRLEVDEIPAVLMLSAAAPGYRTQVEALLFYELREVDFALPPSPPGDDPRYAFVDPRPDRGKRIWNCGNCHRNSFAEWKGSRHARAADSAVTRAVYLRDFLPALERGDAKGDAGLCAACHAPQAALDGRVARLDRIAGVARMGNHCDFCHKVDHVEDPNAPGVRGGLATARPPPDGGPVPGPIGRVYGPLADVDYLFMGAVFNPLFATSVLCSGCHQYRTPSGIPALDTYAEWAAWAVGRPEHESCQSCHMPTGVSMDGNELARRICVHALERPPGQIHDHAFPGRALLPTAVELNAEAKRAGTALELATVVKAVGAGHRVPTGSGDKHLLLLVEALDRDGRPLALLEGPRVPDHAGGEGDPLRLDAAAFRARREAHDFAGLPGREFAQVLADRAGRTHVPFWRASRVVRDTRLEPRRPVTVRHRFSLAGRRGPFRVRVELWHRLRFKRDDPAADVRGEGVRPLDELATLAVVEVR